MSVNIRYNYPLLKHNTFGMDVRAARFITYDTVEDLRQTLKILRQEKCPVLHIGEGSNLLFTKDFEGTVLHSKIRFIEIVSNEEKGVTVRVGSGVHWDDFCDEMAKNDYYGTENLSYIPGEVGACAVQNIGAYGVEACDVIREVETLAVATGEKRIFTNSECRYGYRESIFKNELVGQYIVIAVTFHLSTEPKVHLDYGQLKELQSLGTCPSAKTIRQAVISIRKGKLPEPNELGSAGSFFKNPVVTVTQYERLAAVYQSVPHYVIDQNHIKIPAAWLIEQCGWKGKAIGGAAVYAKQPLIIVNQNRATPEDIVRLATAIQQSVWERFHISIYPEVNYI